MREFVFDLVYEGTTAPLERLCPDAEDPSSRAIGGCIELDEFWRLERFEGTRYAPADTPEEALLASEQITPSSCTGSIHSEILNETKNERELYYHFKNFHGCESVSSLAAEYLGPDVLFEIERSGRRETWTVLLDSEDGVGLFYDSLQVSLADGIRFEFGHIGQASKRRTELFAPQNLPAEQREALIAAVRRGYYERPRQITLEELAEELDCPRSTLSYRLRSAESKLAKSFATKEQPVELESFPQTASRGDGS